MNFWGPLCSPLSNDGYVTSLWFSSLICCSSSLSGTAVTLAFCYNKELPQSRELSNCRTDFFCYFPTSIFPSYLASVTIINPIAFSQNSRANLPLTALNHGAHLSSLLIDVPQGIFSPRIRHIYLLVVKKPTCKCQRYKRFRYNLWVKKIPWRRAWQPTPVFLPGKSH